MSKYKQSGSFYYTDHFALPKSKLVFAMLAAMFASLALLFVMALIIYTPAFGFKKTLASADSENYAANGYPVTFINKNLSIENEAPIETKKHIEIDNLSSQNLNLEKQSQTKHRETPLSSLSEQVPENDSANHAIQKLTNHTTKQASGGRPNTQNRISPSYPQFALLRSIEGYVLAEYTINVDGSASEITILESEPKNVFDEAVLKAIKKFKHSPNIINGEAVAIFGVRNRFEFKLKN